MQIRKTVRQINIDHYKCFIPRIAGRSRCLKLKLAICDLQGWTEDVRNSTVVYYIEKLLQKGFEIRAHASLVSSNASKIRKNNIAGSCTRYNVINVSRCLGYFLRMSLN